MTISPADVNAGIQFIRSDVTNCDRVIPALWHNVIDTRLCTVLANADGVSVSTVEHLMAALRGAGIDNATITVDGPELPIMDGSAEPFLALIDTVGLTSQSATRHVIRVLKRISVGETGRRATLSPASSCSFSFEIDFNTSVIGRQRGHVTLGRGVFRDDLARARTFGFASDIEMLRSRGLALGGSLSNAVVVDGNAILNEGGLRFPDEFVRHKILDGIGDLYLSGAPIAGHFHGECSGHEMNNRLLRALFSDDTAWCYDTLDPSTLPKSLLRAADLAHSA